MTAQMQRKLTTILAADAAGYSRIMEADEVGTLAALQAARQVFSKFIERHYGRIANTAGDGLIAEFPSVVEAVQCAIEVQQELDSRLGEPAGGLRFRIGIHLGDVIVDGNDLLGEGVNLAARLQTMAEPGGILISQQVYDQVHAKLSVGFEFIGGKRPKNYSHNVAIYRISLGRAAPGGAAEARQSVTNAGTLGMGGSRPRTPPEDADGRKGRVVRLAKRLGIALAVLVAIDLATGPSFWVIWPAIAFATILGLEAAPLLARGWFGPAHARIAVVVACLALINAATWSGEPWFLWPAGAIVAIGALYQVGPRLR